MQQNFKAIRTIQKRMMLLQTRFIAQNFVIRRGGLCSEKARKRSSLCSLSLKAITLARRIAALMIDLICCSFKDNLNSTHTAWMKKRRKLSWHRHSQNSNHWRTLPQRHWRKLWIRCRRIWSKTSSAGITWVVNWFLLKKNRTFQKGLMFVQVAMFKRKSRKNCINLVISLLIHPVDIKNRQS